MDDAADYGRGLLLDAGIRDVARHPAAREDAVRCLAHAFRQDPVMAFIFPEEAGRLQRIHALYRMALRGFARSGHILMQGQAAAVWQPPQPRRPGFWQQLGDAAEALWRLRGAAARGYAVQTTMQESKPEQPYWYLAMLGSHPASRGSGAAQQLVRTVMSTCDRDGVAAYLESSHPDNIAYYRRFGFELQGELQIPDGPMLWPMRRAPGGA